MDHLIENDTDATPRKTTLLRLIADSYWRMSTNRDQQYRGEQMAKCAKWLEELTEMYELGLPVS